MGRRSLGPIVAAIVVACATVGCSRDPAAASRRHIERGDRYARDGRYKEAAIEYRNALKATPQSVEAHTRLADVSVRGRDPATAIRELLRVAEIAPNDVAAQVRAGSLYLLAGRFDAARERAESALRLDASSPGAHILLGEALAALHDPKRSEASLRDAVRLAPQSAAAHVALGSQLWTLKQTAEAEHELTRAVSLDPSDPAANRALALFRMATGRAAEAEPLWRPVARSDRGDPFALADFYISQNRRPEAEAELRSLVARPALADIARLRLAGVLYADGARSAAHDLVSAILAEHPHQTAALLMRARFLAAERRFDEALSAAGQAQSTDPTSGDPPFVAGEIHAARGEREQAVQAFQAALKLSPGRAAPATAIAEIRLASGHAEDAIEWADRARAAQPGDPGARLLLVRALLVGGQLERARQEARDVAALWPDAPAARAEPGIVQAQELAEGGAPDKAEQTLRRTIEIDPSNLQAFTMLGNLYLRQGRLEAAREEFTRIAEATPNAVGAKTMTAMILQAEHRRAEARAAYESILAADPRAGVAANNLAWMDGEDRRLDEALTHALAAKRELPRVPEVNDTLGWIYCLRNEPARAIAPLEEAVSARPRNALYREHLSAARKAATTSAGSPGTQARQ